MAGGAQVRVCVLFLWWGKPRVEERRLGAAWPTGRDGVARRGAGGRDRGRGVGREGVGIGMREGRGGVPIGVRRGPAWTGSGRVGRRRAASEVGGSVGTPGFSALLLVALVRSITRPSGIDPSVKIRVSRQGW